MQERNETERAEMSQRLQEVSGHAQELQLELHEATQRLEGVIQQKEARITILQEDRIREVTQLEEQNREKDAEIDDMRRQLETEGERNNEREVTFTREVERAQRAQLEAELMVQQYDSVMDIRDDELNIMGTRLGGGASGGNA